MRSLIVAPLLVTVAIILQGCGGGGSSTTCMNTQIEVVSQSMTGTLKGSTTIKGAKVNQRTDMSGTFSSKMDMDLFNMRMDSVEPVKTTIAGKDVEMKVEMKAIFDAAQKVGVMWHKATNTTSGQVMEQNCTAKTIAQIPAPEQLSQLFNSLVMPALRKATTCGGNDGTYDTWNVAYTHDGALPIPGHNVDMNMSTSMKVQLDKNFLCHSVVEDVNTAQDVKGQGTITTQVHADLDVTDVASGGPKAEDLDYSGWGKCTPVADEDSSTLFHPSENSKVSSVLKRFSNRGVFQTYIHAAIQASKKSPQKAAIVV